MSVCQNDELSLGQVEGSLMESTQTVVSRQVEVEGTSDGTGKPGTIAGSWVFTVVGKDCDDRDTGPAEFVDEDRLVITIKRLMERNEETTHVEIHEGDVG